MNTCANDSHEFTVVLRGPSAAIFPEGEGFLFTDFACSAGLLQMTYQTRYRVVDGGHIAPGHLWIEVKGLGSALEQCIAPFANAGISAISAISVAANAAVGQPDVEVAFDSTPNLRERDFFQCYVPAEGGVLHTARQVRRELLKALVDGVNASEHKERLLRGMEQYRIALLNWRDSHSTFALAHLWMAVEALTKAYLRFQRELSGARNDRDLAVQLGIDIKDLDATIRRDFILQGDSECYEKAKRASDGFEHGFMGFDAIRSHALEVRNRMAKHVRQALLRLAGLSRKNADLLTSPPFDTPLGHWPIAQYLRGTLVGEGKELAAPGNAYPFMAWRTTITGSKRLPDGARQITPQHTITAQLGQGIGLKHLRYEAWEPR